jgi:PKD repeat protein
LLPTPSFTFTPAVPRIGDTVFFDATLSTAGAGHRIASYRWTSSDGVTGTGSTVSHAFTAAGIFAVTLTVVDEVGQSATLTKSIAVGTSTTAPTAVITLSPAAPAVTETVLFNASSSTPGAGHSIASYQWKYGDGSTGTGVTSSHAYAAAGSYQVQLTVTDDVGQAGTSSTVVATLATPPTATFTFLPAAPAVNQNVTFNASSSAPGARRTIASYNWTFGDGATGTGVTPSHTYTVAGTYLVQLTVADDLGQSAISLSTLTIGNPPVPIAAFTVSPVDPTVNQAATFDASTSKPGADGLPIVSYTWTFGDNTATQATSSPTFSHTFGFAGKFNVTLVVKDSGGRVSLAVSNAVTVGAFVPCPDASLPCATLTVSSSPATVNTAITLTAIVSSFGTGAASITNYQWDFGDGTLQTATAVNNIAHTYTSTGTFTAKVTLTNNLGKLGSAVITVLVQ